MGLSGHFSPPKMKRDGLRVGGVIWFIVFGRVEARNDSADFIE